MTRKSEQDFIPRSLQSQQVVRAEAFNKEVGLPEAGYSRLPTVLKHFPVSRSLWLQGCREGRFPRPYHNGRLTFWKNSELIAFFASLEAK